MNWSRGSKTAILLLGSIAALSTFPGAAAAQTVEWTVYNTANSGLPYDGVTVLAIDGQGNVWAGTGRWFAFEHVGIEPDLLCLGKAIAGGLPMGAIAIGTNVSQLPVGVHGSTFGGNPLACAAALATMRIIEEEKHFKVLK